MDDYYNDLSYELRKNGCTDEQVTDALGTVLESTTATGRDPQQEFGTPEDYAAQYHGPRKRSPGSTVLNVFGASGLAVFMFFVVFPDLFPWEFSSRFMQVFGTIILFALWVIVGAFVAGIVDHRPPKAFKETFEKYKVSSN